MTRGSQAEADALFERLFAEFSAPILSYLYRMLGDRSQAEDLAQDVFVRAYRALPGLPADANYRAWLYRVATNRAYDLLRRRRLITWLPLQEREAMPAQDSSPQKDDAVQRALLQLSPRYRVPLILYCVQGYSTAEIAHMLGISVGAVKTRLYRAREAFRQCYAKEQPNGM
jgi:RNA polymerase sigma-70 factor (ECF subfamily)